MNSGLLERLWAWTTICLSMGGVNRYAREKNGLHEIRFLNSYLHEKLCTRTVLCLSNYWFEQWFDWILIPVSHYLLTVHITAVWLKEAVLSESHVQNHGYDGDTAIYKELERVTHWQNARAFGVFGACVIARVGKRRRQGNSGGGNNCCGEGDARCAISVLSLVRINVHSR